MGARRVAVVGAGLAGLAAGLALARAGSEVTVYERTRLLGGKATSFVVDGVEIDNGQHVFLACCTELLGFLSEIGMARHVRMQPRFEAVVAGPGGRRSSIRALALPAPWHLVLALAAYRHLGWAGKLGLARALGAARSGEVPPGQTFAGWLDAQRQGAPARRAFWDPFFVPAFNAGPAEVSADDALFVLRTAFLGDPGAARFAWLDVPLAAAASAAAERIGTVHLRAPVARVLPGPELVLAGGTSARYDGVVVAVPPRRVQNLGGLGVEGLGGFTANPIVDVHLWYDRDPGFSFTALLDSPVQWVFHKDPGRVCCSLSAASERIGRSEAELVAECDAELRARIPGLRDARLLRSGATRDPTATFVPAPGLRRPGPRTAIEGVVVAGAWTATGWPATMESAVRSGRAAAAALLEEVPAVA
jgi:squalene-associated FAD-dependent desaturase